MSDQAKTVLLADDELFMLRLLAATFRKGGYQTVQVRNGTEALAAAVTVNPHLIVMDVIMPGIDGLSTVRQLKQNVATQHIPVIVLSSKAYGLTKAQAEEAGAALFLTKPFSPSQLLSEAQRLLGLA
jgi:two-component system phosphate regulon response regulator PhoB